jgi:hypothetical protein
MRKRERESMAKVPGLPHLGGRSRDKARKLLHAGDSMTVPKYEWRDKIRMRSEW